MQYRGSQISFPPVYDEHSHVLLLGSYPSPKSFEQGFYYGHPQNRFWKLLSLLTRQPLPDTIQEKKTLLLSQNLALWDALESCQIVGASDTSITNPVPNQIPALLEKTNIQTIFCNGAASHHIYTKYCQPFTGIAATKLPSTSPANAAYSLEKLAKEWAVLLPFIKNK